MSTTDKILCKNLQDILRKKKKIKLVISLCEWSMWVSKWTRSLNRFQIFGG